MPRYGPKPRPELERFWSKVRIIPDCCWEWTARDNGVGYGMFMLTSPRPNVKSVLAHRYAYELLVGPIPEGLQLDHLCRNRRCVNPDHLEPVTNRENVLRGTSIFAREAALTHCLRGHPFDEENTYLPARGGRQCRACRRATSHEYEKHRTRQPRKR
jgi:HNH endonuclease